MSEAKTEFVMNSTPSIKNYTTPQGITKASWPLGSLLCMNLPKSPKISKNPNNLVQDFVQGKPRASKGASEETQSDPERL
jgi:hypothetical protein